MKICRLRCNYDKEPKGISGIPQFSWVIESKEQGTFQTALQLVIFDGEREVYDSGKVETKQSLAFEPKGLVLAPETVYRWRVTVWDNHGNEAAAESVFETAKAGWTAKWIEPANGGIGYERAISMVQAFVFRMKPKGSPEERLMPITFMRKEFAVKPDLKSARVYATAHGIYEFEVNGTSVNKGSFDPQYSSYDQVLFYQTYDITDQLTEGKNACGVMLFDGWYGGRCGMGGECRQYGDNRGFLMEITLEYEDGQKETVLSDESFHWTDQGDIRYSDIFIGEMLDHRLLANTEGFSKAGFREDGSWSPVVVRDYGYRELAPQVGPGVHQVMEFQAKLIRTPKGEQVLDFGQNIAGYVRAKLRQPAGTKVKLEHAEVLSKEGNYFSNIMGINKDQTDYYICAGTGEEIFEPHYTFHGFRYVKVTGIEKVDPKDFTAINISSDMEELGQFACSNKDLNQLYSNSRFSQYANMISLPTDCPQREKAGWTGDIQVYGPTASYHQNMDPFLTRWLASVRAEQTTEGEIPSIIPYSQSYRTIMEGMFHARGSCGWSDCCIIVPYTLYQMYGDTAVLKENYDTMKRWVAYMEKEASTKNFKTFEKKKNKTASEIENRKYLWDTGFHFGDWLVPSLKGKDLNLAKKNEPVFSSIYYAYSTGLLAEIARVLGDQEAAEKYQRLHDRICKAFDETYIREDGYIAVNTQGVYICALYYGTIAKEKRAGACGFLRKLIEANGCRLDTGFLATPILLDTLMENGMKDLAEKILYQEECPSWMYEIRKGATTIWESWTGIRPDGKVEAMSFNHYAFGCVSTFLHQHIVGIRSLAPGYEKILIKPDFSAAVENAEGSFLSMYGRISCKWEKKDGETEMQLEIPCNTTALVELPDGSTSTVESGSYVFRFAGAR